VRVLVFGNSGSGKSTYARALAARHGLAHLDLDTIVWDPAKFAVQRPLEAIEASLQAFFDAESAWVVEGCYGDVVELAAPRCTELVFLNPGVEACLANNLRRPWEPHKYGSLEEQNAHLAFLQGWVVEYYTRGGPSSYAEHRRIFDAHPGPKVELTGTSDS
jgi:adenylate kinase family enzyme